MQGANFLSSCSLHSFLNLNLMYKSFRLVIILFVFVLVRPPGVLSNNRKQSEHCGELSLIPTDIRTLVPWTAAIFRRSSPTENSWKFHTSGIVIGPGLIYSTQGGPVGKYGSNANPLNFFVVTGINSTDFSVHDQFAQYSRVTFVQPYTEDPLGSVYVHGVIYHLEGRLNFSTPYVKEICLPAFIGNPRTHFSVRNIPNLRWSYLQFGFAKSVAASSPRGKEPWLLKVWKTQTPKKEVCDSIARYYYRDYESQVSITCSVRTENSGRNKIFRAFTSTGILDSLKLGDYSEGDDQLCHSHGSGLSIGLGKTWYLAGRVSVIPSLRRGRCNNDTVYIVGIGDNRAYTTGLQWLLQVSKCGANRFSCGDSNCIPMSMVCNNVVDCVTQVDEHFGICNRTVPKTKVNAINNVDATDYSISDRNAAILFPDSEESSSNETIITKTREKSTMAFSAGKSCPFLEIPSEGARCWDMETLAIVPCDADFYPGRRIRVECDEYHRARRASYEKLELFCNFDGEWTGLRSFLCEADCGHYEEGYGKSSETNLYTGLPWEASIFQNNVQICGGTLIEPSFVLTHSRCVKSWLNSQEERTKFQVLVRPVSSTNYGKNLEGFATYIFGIKNVYRNTSTHQNEVKSEEIGLALIQLDSAVEINGRNKPTTACYLLPSIRKDAVGPGQVGIISNYDETDSILVQNMTVVSHHECSGMEVYREIAFCGSLTNTGESRPTAISKYGDYGTGIVFQYEQVNAKKSYVLHAISSGRKGDHTVFLDIAAFSNWILDTLETKT